MDDMASRIDVLEKSLEELLQQSISEEIVTEESKSWFFCFFKKKLFIQTVYS